MTRPKKPRKTTEHNSDLPTSTSAKKRTVSELDVESLLQGLILADLMVVSPPVHEATLRYLVSRIRNVAIHIYCDEGKHRRPHFHARINSEYEASYAIDTSERLAGELPRNLEPVVLKWAKDNREKLLAGWAEAASGRGPTRIEASA